VVDHLFRTEAGRLVPALVRILGVHNVDLAEDIVQDVLVSAFETWRFGELPDNPAAWLTRAARNRALDVVRRKRTETRFASDIESLVRSEWTVAATVQELFSEAEIRDDQLRMMFSCCAPNLASELHVAAILRLLCGFGISEIARAFLTTEATVEKRLTRAKAALRESGRLFEFRGSDGIIARLPSVEQALYLLFNEGYHSTDRESVVREDLCREALRLAGLLTEHPAVSEHGSPHALLAVFCLHAARLRSRIDSAGDLVPLDEQDRSQWDSRLIAEGLRQLSLASGGSEAGPLHVEAGIAAIHCQAERFEDTDFAAIADLYELLFTVRPTPIVALNRAVAIGFARGPDAGLEALAEIPDAKRLAGYHFLATAEGELLRRAGRRGAAKNAFRRALDSVRTAAERRFVERRIAECDGD
jgi:RNA polymerase sigma-70 factor (ECF subfamily)